MRDPTEWRSDGAEIRCFLARCASRQTIEISPEDIRKYLRDTDCHLWLDIQGLRPEHDAWLTAVFGLHPLATEDLHNEEVLPKNWSVTMAACSSPSAMRSIGRRRRRSRRST